MKHWVDTVKITGDHYKLYNPFMRERLMFTAASDFQVWLRERNPCTCSQLVDMADAYQLAHKHSYISQYQKEGG